MRFTRQRVEQLERSGLRRLGVSASLEEAVHAGERAERARALAERGRRVRAAELHGAAAAVRRRVARWEREHEAAVAAILATA